MCEQETGARTNPARQLHKGNSAPAEAFDLPGPSRRGSQQEASAPPEVKTDIRRTASDKGKETNRSFLEKYRANRAARKSRGSKDMTNNPPPPQTNGSLPPRHSAPDLPEPPRTSIPANANIPIPAGAAKGAVPMALDELPPRLLQQLIAESTDPFLQDTADIKVVLEANSAACSEPAIT